MEFVAVFTESCFRDCDENYLWKLAKPSQVLLLVLWVSSFPGGHMTQGILWLQSGALGSWAFGSLSSPLLWLDRNHWNMFFSIRMKNIEKKRCWNQFKTNKNSTPWGNTKLVKTTLLPFVFIYHSFSKSNFPKQYWITTVWDFSFRTMLPRRLTYCIQLSLLPLVFDLETKSHFMF